ncbi:hypothetical protein PISMIDRAFT_18789 [Pisolithus microcarpus 441]|uniref:Uncharacterized protein n=1 Tax=Pisolithus microcarpus 441 TaxID=765257 RepID=A0A0C9YPR2_9AGAM|nr:hypothetical protein PISMIDRAFT_18789 [Pisolithus microcarpus 441]
MAALTRIDVKLHIAGIDFDEEEWLGLIGVILMNPMEGLHSIKAAQQLAQAGVVPLLEDAAVWQLVLRWVGDDSFSFDSFLQEMQDRFEERYNFNHWKTIFDQVFEASHEGTAVEVVRAAMSEHGVLNPPSVPNLSSSQALSSEESTDDPRNKGKSKAQESKVAGGDGNINENSDLIQVSVSIDDAIIIPPSTLQLSKERGYDVSRGPAVGAEGPVPAVDFPSGHLMALSKDSPWHDVPISFCVKVEDFSLHDQEYHVGHEVWITSGPSKGCRGMLRLVGRTLCMVRIHSSTMQFTNTAVVSDSGMLLNGTPLDFTRMAAFIALHRRLFAEIAPPPYHATPPPSLSAVDPLAEPGPSASTSNPWIVNTDDVAMPRPNKAEKQQIDYGT